MLIIFKKLLDRSLDMTASLLNSFRGSMCSVVPSALLAGRNFSEQFQRVFWTSYQGPREPRTRIGVNRPTSRLDLHPQTGFV